MTETIGVITMDRVWNGMIMKTIKTITCHNVYNYGASLQAYALLKHLLHHGFHAEIIDYQPVYQYPQPFHYFPEGTRAYKILQQYPFLRSLFVLRKLLRSFFSKQKIHGIVKKSFDRFTREELRLTPMSYRSNHDLVNHPPIADVFIAGSDQIWNTKKANGRDPAFYLDFADKSAKKISYAASFSTKQIYGNYESFVTEKLKNFDAVSVREKTGLRILDQLNIQGGVQVLDPVFLLSKNQWKELIKNTYREKYLLVYDIHRTFRTQSIIPEIAKEIAKRKSLQIWSVNAVTKMDDADRTVWGGPVEFLELINSAEYVVSDSFHGTAFSTIFNKNFYTVGLPDGFDMESRIVDFLDSIGLQSRYITNISDIDEMSEIDYADVNEKLSIPIENSKKFLEEALSMRE